MVDTNRDGHLDELDEEGEDTWTIGYGAAFLANIDDDDQDGEQDADDNFVNNDADALDLARIGIRAWPDAPEGASGLLTIDEGSIPHVRVFKHNSDGSWELVLGSDGPCGVGGDTTCAFSASSLEITEQELVSGVEFGIEARRYPNLPESTVGSVVWDGLVDLSLVAYEADGETPVLTEDNPEDGVDRAQIRVAPWILFGNLTPVIDTIFATTGSSSFISGLETALDDAEDVYFNKISNWGDIWTEDFFQTGFSSIPAADGAVQGMRVAMPRPWGRGSEVEANLPRTWLKNNHLYPDGAFVKVYNVDWSGSTTDSYGNHDLIPPYTNGDASYPFGRIIYGDGDYPILQETQDWYENQLVQAPALTLDTSWLIVQHVDEVFSYVPAATERGWKLLVGSPRLAKEMLEQWSADGYGDATLFDGKTWWDNSSAQISIDELLADTDIMQWSQTSQTEIDSMLEDMVAAIGLEEDEIIEIPYLFERDYGAMVAYNPGTVNSLVFSNFFIAPDPFGPEINGVDGFQQDLLDRLGTDVNGLGADGQGLDLYFVDNWDWYHVNLGEVHCGTNQEGPPQADIQWWEAMQ